MSVNLTKVRARLNNVKKNLYYNNLPPLELYKVKSSGKALLATITDNWYVPTSLTSNFALSSEYFELYVADVDGSLDDALTSATTAIIAGEHYTIIQKTRPRGVTKQWSMRLELTGEKE